jgi:hypothetical protein
MRDTIVDMSLRLLLGFVIPAMTLVPSGALAQGAPASSGSTSGVQCLSRTFVDAHGTAQPLTIYVPAGEASAYAGRGFAAGACGATSLAAYRTQACQAARLGNTAVQNRLTQVLGVSPKDLCESANRAAQLPTSGN